MTDAPTPAAATAELIERLRQRARTEGYPAARELNDAADALVAARARIAELEYEWGLCKEEGGHALSQAHEYSKRADRAEAALVAAQARIKELEEKLDAANFALDCNFIDWQEGKYDRE